LSTPAFAKTISFDLTGFYLRTRGASPRRFDCNRQSPNADSCREVGLNG
jgi:hypothetical protein